MDGHTCDSGVYDGVLVVSLTAASTQWLTCYLAMKHSERMNIKDGQEDGRRDAWYQYSFLVEGQAKEAAGISIEMDPDMGMVVCFEIWIWIVTSPSWVISGQEIYLI